MTKKPQKGKTDPTAPGSLAIEGLRRKREQMEKYKQTSKLCSCGVCGATPVTKGAPWVSVDKMPMTLIVTVPGIGRRKSLGTVLRHAVRHNTFKILDFRLGNGA